MSIPSFHPSLHTRVEGDQSKGALIPQGYIQAANINSSTNIYMKLRSTNENFFHKKRVNFQYDKDNRGYVMAKHACAVQQWALEKWKDSDDAGRYRNRSIEDLENHKVSKRTIGRVIDVDFRGPTVKLNVILMMVGNFLMGQMVLFWSLSWSLPSWYLGFRFPAVRPKPAL